ncbi:MAG: alkane 1-monooxygenase [Sulfitobacter sp.]
MFWYLFCGMLPVVLLSFAGVLGGIWAWLAFGSITALALCADRLRISRPARPGSGRWVNAVLAACHFSALPFAVWALAGGQNHPPLDQILIFLCAGLWLGQVSNSNAHELIHAPQRRWRRLGCLIYASLLHGHHASAHLLVHHVRAATPGDPNSAPLGMGFYRFLRRAICGEFTAGFEAERRRCAPHRHPYLGYGAAALICFALSYLLAGWGGIIAYLTLCAYAQLQLYLSDYVQHYGLLRAALGGGKFAPIGPAHSWNAAPWYSGAMMLNAPRHSDHHQNPARPYPALRLTPAMPLLPRSLPQMAVLALFPPLWRRVMDPRALKHRI